MASKDLNSADLVKQIYESKFLPHLKESTVWQGWLSSYVELIDKVRSASVDELASPAFQNLLWEANNISGSGMCTIPMTEAIHSNELAKWIASLRDRDLPPPGPQRIDALRQIYEELLERTRQFTPRRPWLKIARLLAALYPTDISCVVDHPKLRQLVRAMFGKLPKGDANMIAMNAQVYNRLNEILGPSGQDTESVARRSMFAWELYKATVDDEVDEGGEVIGPLPGESKLKFLPNERRAKGLTALTGYVDTALKVLDFVQNGATIAETQEYYHQESPLLKETSVKGQLSTIRYTLGLLRLNGTTLEPSALGQKLLETEDPTILIPRMLTRVVGFDLILFLLKEKGPRDRAELLAALKQHYPRWTTDFAPSSLLAWAQHLTMIQSDGDQRYTLTEVGQEWADQITEKPKPIPMDFSGSLDTDGTPAPRITGTLSPPALAEILDVFDRSAYVYPREVIAKLHVALHMDPFKHFVLLSGLSGTGKTKLAELYANAYHRVENTKQNRFFLLVPVQPDWTDPTGLLGYINPLQETVTYAATPFLAFLKAAVASPKIAHFVCLDEMNLARVEYYFAPFLSAMETKQDIVIHQNDEPVDTIEPALPWPGNLYVIGTVNMDETTHAFSDKVLDRAFTLEFWDVDLDDFSKRYAASNPGYPSGLLRYATEMLVGLKKILEPARQHFGYRTAGEILNFLGTNHAQGDGVMSQIVALDQALLMKTLPKIRGQDSGGFRECLKSLYGYLESNGLAASARKIAAMKEEMELTGTTRFWR